MMSGNNSVLRRDEHITFWRLEAGVLEGGCGGEEGRSITIFLGDVLAVRKQGKSCLAVDCLLPKKQNVNSEDPEDAGAKAWVFSALDSLCISSQLGAVVNQSRWCCSKGGRKTCDHCSHFNLTTNLGVANMDHLSSSVKTGLILGLISLISWLCGDTIKSKGTGFGPSILCLKG